MAKTMRITTGSIVRAVLIAGAWLIGLAALSRATTVVVWFAEASVIAALSYPIVTRLCRWVPKWVAVLGLTALAAAAAVLLSVSVFTEMRDQANDFKEAAPAGAQRLEESDAFGSVARRMGLEQKVTVLATGIADRFELNSDQLAGLAGTLGTTASAVLVVWILSVMLLVSGPSMVKRTLDGLRPDTARRVSWVLGRAYARSCRYSGWMFAHALVASTVGYLAARFLGLSTPLVLAVWIGIWAFVPDVGLVVGVLALTLVAALDDPATSLVIIVLAVAVQALDVHFLQSRIDRGSLHLGAFLTVGAALVGFSLYGAGGLFLAVIIVQFSLSVLTDIGALNDLSSLDPDPDLEAVPPELGAEADLEVETEPERAPDLEVEAGS